MPLTQITTHAADAVSRLIEQYRDKAGMRALISAFASRAQATENAMWDLFTLRDIDSATADALDQLGAIVGQARQSADDTTYRLYVRTRIAINRSSGTAEDLIGVLSAAVPGIVVEIIDRYPAAFDLRVVGATDADLVVILAKFVREARAAGVGCSLLWQPAADADMFRTADPNYISVATVIDSIPSGSLDPFLIRGVYGPWPFGEEFTVTIDPGGGHEETSLITSDGISGGNYFIIADGGGGFVEDHDAGERVVVTDVLGVPLTTENAGKGFAEAGVGGTGGQLAGVILIP